MNASIKRSLAALLLMSFGIASQAQQAQPSPQPAQPGPRSLTKEQQAALDQRDQEVAQVAVTIVRMIDQGKAAQVWDDASPVAKQIIARDAFVKKVAQDRAQLGAPGLRMPMGVRHFQYDGTGNMPKGTFINVSFDTQFSRTAQSSREMVTFILDSDRIWRFVGYSVR